MSERLNWQKDIEPHLDLIEHASSGFTTAIRGTIEPEPGRKVFVKVGQTDQEKAWADKERRVYHWLADNGYRHIPQLLAERDGAIALEDLSDLDWSAAWTEEKLMAALQAMDSLAGLSAKAASVEFFNAGREVEKSHWQDLLADAPRATAAFDASQGLLDQGRASGYLALTKEVTLAGDTLIHEDVRHDNFAYDPDHHTGYLVDWNWARMGNSAIDRVAFLVSVERGGYSVVQKHADLLDRLAALWLAGFWFNHGTQPPPREDERAKELRTHQIESGIQALRFAALKG